MHYVICPPLPDYMVPYGNAPVDDFEPIWKSDYLIYIAM